MQERDLDVFYSKFNNLEYRGAFFPIGLQSEAKFRNDFAANGFWDRDEGMLLIVTPDDEIVGEIEFFPITNYLVGYELSYLIFGHEHALHRRGSPLGHETSSPILELAVT